MKARTKFKLHGGEQHTTLRCINGQIDIVGTGKQTYLWIGNSYCFGTLSGQKTLEKLAKNILKSLKR